MTRTRPILIGAVGGLLLGIVTRLLFGVFDGHSLAGQIFATVHGPEFMVIERLGAFYPGHPEQAWTLLLPIHLVYWSLIGAIIGFFVFMVLRCRDEKNSHHDVQQ